MSLYASPYKTSNRCFRIRWISFYIQQVSHWLRNQIVVSSNAQTDSVACKIPCSALFDKIDAGPALRMTWILQWIFSSCVPYINDTPSLVFVYAFKIDEQHQLYNHMWSYASLFFPILRIYSKMLQADGLGIFHALHIHGDASTSRAYKSLFDYTLKQTKLCLYHSQSWMCKHQHNISKLFRWGWWEASCWILRFVMDSESDLLHGVSGKPRWIGI